MDQELMCVFLFFLVKIWNYIAVILPHSYWLEVGLVGKDNLNFCSWVTEPQGTVSGLMETIRCPYTRSLEQMRCLSKDLSCHP